MRTKTERIITAMTTAGIVVFVLGWALAVAVWAQHWIAR